MSPESATRTTPETLRKDNLQGQAMAHSPLLPSQILRGWGLEAVVGDLRPNRVLAIPSISRRSSEIIGTMKPRVPKVGLVPP